MINVYTDGASRGNPGPGGYGVILEWRGHIKEISEGFRLTTNNRMELLAVIIALEALKKENQEVVVTSDSKYVVDAVEKEWLFNWERKNWKKVKNPDLWQRFLKIFRKHRVRLVWVRGHNEHPQNERCDELAVEAALSGNLKVDTWYEENV